MTSKLDTAGLVERLRPFVRRNADGSFAAPRDADLSSLLDWAEALTAIGETHVIVPRDGTLARAFVTARVEGHYQTAWTEVFVDAASLEALLPATNVRVAILREPELAAAKEGE